MSLFTDARDGEMNALLAEIPDDRSGSAPPEPERIFGSLPTADMAAITVPGLSSDFLRAQSAWQNGTLRSEPQHRKGAMIAAAIAVLLLLLRIRFRRRLQAASTRPY